MTLLRSLASLGWLLAAIAFAHAGAGTITTKDAGSVTRTFVIVTDGTGNFIAPTVICDGVAGANCAGVGAVSNLASAVTLLDALAVGQYNATPPTITDTRYNALQLDVNGNLKVTGGVLGDGTVSLANVPTSAISGQNLSGNAITPMFDPCQYLPHVVSRGVITSATTAVVIAGTSAKKTYVCYGLVGASAATIHLIVEGSGSTCGTNKLALGPGDTTTANGISLNASGGITYAMPAGKAIFTTTVNANDMCITTNGSGPTPYYFKSVAL